MPPTIGASPRPDRRASEDGSAPVTHLHGASSCLAGASNWWRCTSKQTSSKTRSPCEGNGPDSTNAKPTHSSPAHHERVPRKSRSQNGGAGFQPARSTRAASPAGPFAGGGSAGTAGGGSPRRSEWGDDDHRGTDCKWSAAAEAPPRCSEDTESPRPTAATLGRGAVESPRRWSGTSPADHGNSCPSRRAATPPR